MNSETTTPQPQKNATDRPDRPDRLIKLPEHLKSRGRLNKYRTGFINYPEEKQK
jgi:hypothetical protein